MIRCDPSWPGDLNDIVSMKTVGNLTWNDLKKAWKTWKQREPLPAWTSFATLRTSEAAQGHRSIWICQALRPSLHEPLWATISQDSIVRFVILTPTFIYTGFLCRVPHIALQRGKVDAVDLLVPWRPLCTSGWSYAQGVKLADWTSAMSNGIPTELQVWRTPESLSQCDTSPLDNFWTLCAGLSLWSMQQRLQITIDVYCASLRKRNWLSMNMIWNPNLVLQLFHTAPCPHRLWHAQSYFNIVFPDVI